MHVCHKDIHPGNILVSDDLAMIKISDFGLSEFKLISSVYLTLKPKGHYMYYPPEFATKGGSLRHVTLSDVYSMGAVLCELFAELPFWHFANTGEAYSSANVAFILNDQLTKPRDPEVFCKLEQKVAKILKHAIAPDLNDRKSAREMAEKFRNI